MLLICIIPSTIPHSFVDVYYNINIRHVTINNIQYTINNLHSDHNHYN